ncbi:MAG: hypothetical protein NC253_10355 [Ruminococcus sp.]|nr:hypothetical protein [Ruminococcus sp.]MCM1380716.1 hypothetical protein [Muribaculaceae bacterium]MCM1479782.1 hypothetical protein [Muribaculaceae bacterium]
MKKKIIFAIILSAILLTSCNSGETEISETSAESGITTVSETSAVTTVTTTVTTIETVEEMSAETTISETLPPVVENIGEGVSLEYEIVPLDGVLASNEHFGNFMFISGNTAAMVCYGDSDRGEMRFFGLDDMSVKADIAAPDDWEWHNREYYPCIGGNDDILCKLQLSHFNSETSQLEYAALIVHDDFTTEVAEGEPREIFSFPAGEHNISDYPYDIVDTDSGEVIVEGFDDTETELGFNYKSFDYIFSVDGERFVYRVCGFEQMPAFGYYDFSAEKAVEFDNSRNLMPVGYHGGKIFAEETAWDGVCLGELYTFDIETGEKEHFMSSPVEFERTADFDEYTEYCMPPNGGYIVAEHFKYDYSEMNGTTDFYIISPESGETLAKCTLETFGVKLAPAFIGDEKFAVYDNVNREIIIFTVTL